ncbi:MAG: PPC domain-containing protein, partial [Candidatus Thorarchaeota archaeon]|nr:PPC domain-containing protein [Candidatus Thorarchaeota archaeon]
MERGAEIVIFISVLLVLILSVPVNDDGSDRLTAYSPSQSFHPSAGGSGSSFADSKTLLFGLNSDSLPGPAPDDSIYYEIGLSAGQDVDFTLQGEAGTDFDLYLYDASQTLVDISSLSSYPEQISVSVTTAQGYFVKVSPYSGTGDFNLSVSSSGDSFSDTISLPLDGIEGILPGPGSSNENYYSLYLNKDTQFNISMVHDPSDDFDILLYNSTQHLVVSNTSSDSFSSISGVANISQKFYIVISPNTGEGDYSLSIQGSGLTIENAIPMTYGSRSDEFGGSSYPAFYYRIDFSRGQEITIQMDGDSSLDYELVLYNKDLQVLRTTTRYSGTVYLTYTIQNTGTYYLRSRCISYSGKFTLTTTGTGVSFSNAIPRGTENRSGVLPGPSGDSSIYYQFMGYSNTTLDITLFGTPGTDFDFRLYAENHTLLKIANSLSYPEYLSYSVNETSVYFLQVVPKAGLGNFTLSMGEIGLSLDSAVPIE